MELRWGEIEARELPESAVRSLPRVALALTIGEPRIAGDRVLLEALLTTPDHEARIAFCDFGLMLVDEAVRVRPMVPPMPPPCPPPPRVFTAPPSSRIAFSASLALDRYDWSGAPTVKLVWVFGVANAESAQGELRIALPLRS